MAPILEIPPPPRKTPMQWETPNNCKRCDLPSAIWSSKIRRRTNVQQLTCKIDLSSSFYYLFLPFVLLELKPFFWRGKSRGKNSEKVWKSAKNHETILPFSCCPLVFLWKILPPKRPESMHAFSLLSTPLPALSSTSSPPPMKPSPWPSPSPAELPAGPFRTKNSTAPEVVPLGYPKNLSGYF